MKTLLPLLIIIVAILGVLDASYLTYEKLSGTTPACAPPFDCGEVLNSQWASIGPIPLSAFGVGYYLSVLIAGSLSLLGIPTPVISTKKILLLLTSFGFLFSAVLVGLMAFVIHAWCLYCLYSATFSTILFITSLVLNRSPEPLPESTE